MKIHQSKFHNNISSKWSEHYVILTQTENYCYITSCGGQNRVQMANEKLIHTVRKCVLGDSLRITTYPRVFTLFLCRPRAQFWPMLHQIREVSRSHTFGHIRTPVMTPLYK